MLVAITLSGRAAAQFVPPAEPRADTDGFAVLTDGRRIEGHFRSVTSDDGALRFVMVATDGHRYRFYWDEIAEMAQRLDPDRLLPSVALRLSAAGVEHQYWQRIVVPEAAGTELLPLLDLGFDSFVSVYPDPMAQIRPGTGATGAHSTLRIDGRRTGGVGLVREFSEISAGSFLVLPRGEDTPLVVTARSYGELWERLFGGCEAHPRPEEPRFTEFSREILSHHEACDH